MTETRKAVQRAACAVLAGAAWSAVATAGQPVTLTLTGADGRAVADVAVYLADVHAPGPGAPVIVDQLGETFVPAVSVVTAGSDVLFTNSDPTSHHVYSFSRPNTFALPLYKGDDRLRVRFDEPGVVVLGCNIHDSMVGFVVVVASTRHGITGADGRVTLADVPAGRHGVRAWAPGLDRDKPPEVGAIEVSATAPASARFTLAVPGAAKAARKSGSIVESDY